MILPQRNPGEFDLPAHEFGTTAQLMAAAGGGHEPTIIMLTCWELGSAPQDVSFAQPGEIIIAQNPGGLVPSAAAQQAGSALDTIRYGLTRPTVRHLIVCGHTQCKTLGLLLVDDKRNLPNPFRDLMHSTENRIEATRADHPSDEPLDLIVEASVLQQLVNLRTHRDIRQRLEAGKLLMHGWVRNDLTASIRPYDPTTGRFAS